MAPAAVDPRARGRHAGRAWAATIAVVALAVPPVLVAIALGQALVLGGLSGWWPRRLRGPSAQGDER
jgi:ABC-type spermidine/putrescine transport system permease subunit II